MGLATAIGQDDGDEFEYDGEGFNFDDQQEMLMLESE